MQAGRQRGNWGGEGGRELCQPTMAAATEEKQN
jgi:hypothetical protein